MKKPNENMKLRVGKYFGRTPLEVLEHDPSYVKWLIDNNIIAPSKAFEEMVYKENNTIKESYDKN